MTVTRSVSTSSVCCASGTASSTPPCRSTTTARGPCAGWTRSAEELPRIHDPVRVETGLHGAQHVQPGGSELTLEPRRVIAADSVMVGQRRACGEQRIGGGALGLGPL